MDAKDACRTSFCAPPRAADEVASYVTLEFPGRGEAVDGGERGACGEGAPALEGDLGDGGRGGRRVGVHLRDDGDSRVGEARSARTADVGDPTIGRVGEVSTSGEPHEDSEAAGGSRVAASRRPTAQPVAPSPGGVRGNDDG